MNLFNSFILPTLIISTPLMLAAIGGMFSEKSGIINIGLEGIMTFCAFLCASAIYLLEINTSLGSNMIVILAILISISGGVLMSGFHGYMTITLKVDQTISGTVLNIVGLALGVFLTNIMFFSNTTPMFSTQINRIFGVPLIVILSFLLIPIVTFALNYTKWGKYIKGAGENPYALSSMGIDVIKKRYEGVLLSGVFAALAGSVVILTSVNSFSSSVIAGKGFIALAILIFARWQPGKIILVSLFFGGLSALGLYFSVQSIVPIDPIYFDILPYVLTIVALVVFSKKDYSPKALGKEY